MIELAPDHKIGLPLANPMLIAAGCAGYGDRYRHLIDLSAFGALITNPVTLRPQRGSPQPRLVETETGIILNTGRQNPGVKKVIRQHSKFWRSLEIPVIAHLPADDPDDMRRTAQALAGTDTIEGIELGLPPNARSYEVRFWVEAVREGCLLPLLLKLPFEANPELLDAAVQAQADGLVIGSPPRGAAPGPTMGSIVSGEVYGPQLHQLALYNVQQIAQHVEMPVIAAGGIHSLADAELLLGAGAVAVQIDSLFWLDPKQAEAIAYALGTVD